MKKIVRRVLIESKILIIRGQKVVLGMHLAGLYRVETRALNQAVKRNIRRFPEDFMFQLTAAEAEHLVSQSVIPHRKYFGGSLPYAFTEQGVAMLSSVLTSERAVQVNIAIMRAFVNLREFLSTHKELALQLAQQERRIDEHDEEISVIFDAIRKLMTPPAPPRRKIGFAAKERNATYKRSRRC
ncbi:MAG: ORF6N domain-containing protein [Acidobacteriia bacterium]|nr:ORF6N domain-containing protein [Terriglobia bacterium]